MMTIPPAPFPFHLDKQDPSSAFPLPPPSPPNIGLDFDIESFTNCSPGTTLFDDVTAFSPSTPTSTTLVSPKSSIPDVAAFFPISADNDPTAAEALSNHHLQRYLHYKNLAAQAEADAQIAQNDQIEALLASCAMPGDESFQYDTLVQPYSTASLFTQPTWDTAYSFPAQSAMTAHAQAQLHMQAHEALAFAQQKRAPDYCMPTFDFIQQANWSRQSVSTQSASPPFPSTPIAMSISPIVAAPRLQTADLTFNLFEGGDGIEEGEDTKFSRANSEDIKPGVDDTVPNLHGGGRGYVPGKTPDDPSKRHKCRVCGRGFARAFNLKSHVQTHNPSRPKPHQCPHANCKRSFSRLHDLERHRQGIHFDGPLVEAKRQGVAASVARAQNRMQKRAESGGLI